jgi:hypothetical protein
LLKSGKQIMDEYLFFQVHILPYIGYLWIVCLFYSFSFLKCTHIIQHRWDMSHTSATSGIHEVFVKSVLENNGLFLKLAYHNKRCIKYNILII